MSELPQDDNQQPKDDGGFIFWIIGLLAVMLVSVAGLWLVEKGRTNRAYGQIRKQNEYIARQQGQMHQLGGMLAQTNIKKIDPASLPTEKHKFDGKDVNVIMLDEFSAQTHGLKAGDVILVAPTPMGPVAR